MICHHDLFCEDCDGVAFAPHGDEPDELAVEVARLREENARLREENTRLTAIVDAARGDGVLVDTPWGARERRWIDNAPVAQNGETR